jgi:type I restriction enzyme S subunit
MKYLKAVANGAVSTPLILITFDKNESAISKTPQQRRIADILSAYDDMIENNNKRIALLEKAAQELYKEWFVRFRSPVTRPRNLRMVFQGVGSKTNKRSL